MTRTLAPRPLIVLGLTLLIVANAVLFGGRLTAWVTDASGHLLAPLAGRVAYIRALAATTFARGDLAQQNIALKQEVLRIQSELVGQEELRRQLEFYRSAAALRERVGKEPIAAGIFSYPQAGGVRQAIINRGHDDWVVLGDIVVTPTGALVGFVSRVFEHHATVSIIGDVNVDVTVRVAGTDVSGLLRTTADGTIVMDLVQKNETVSEGAIVVSSGDDVYPAGLLIGTVRSVQDDVASLFKTVRIAPAITDDVSGDVIVIRP